MKHLLIACALALSGFAALCWADEVAPVTVEAQAAAITSLTVMPRTFALADVSNGKARRISVMIDLEVDVKVLSMPYTLGTGGAGNLKLEPGKRREIQNLLQLMDVKAPGKYGITIAGRNFPDLFEITE